MNSKMPMLALLVGLSFLWFFTGIAATIIFSFSLGAYGDAGDAATFLMGASLASMIAWPMICGHTLIRGWRRFAEGDYGRVWPVALIPLPFLGLAVGLFMAAWD